MKVESLFKNLVVLVLDRPLNLSADQISDAVQIREFRHCERSEDLQTGFVKFENGKFAKKSQHYISMTFAVEKKSVPASVVKTKLAEKVADYKRQGNGSAPGKKLLKELKEAVISELIPRAFPKYSETVLWFDLKSRRMYLNNTNAQVLEYIKKALADYLKDDMPYAMPPQITHTVPIKLTQWILDGAPSELTVDDNCELQQPSAEKPTIKYLRHSLDGEEIKEFIEAGRVPISLAMTFDSKVSFNFNNKLEFKGIKMLDQVAKVQIEDELEAEGIFILQAGILDQMATRVLEELGLEEA